MPHESSPLIVNSSHEVINEYELLWSYPKVVALFFKSGVIYALVRTTNLVGEIATGVLFSRLQGPQYVAANSLIVVSSRVFSAPIISALFSMGPRFSKCKNDAEIGDLIRQGLVAATILSVAVTPVLLTSGKLFRLFGQDPEVCNIVEDFYLAAALNIPWTIISSVLQQFALGISQQKSAFIINVVNIVLSIVMGGMLMFGLPELGVSGMGYGYSIAAVLTMVTYIVYLRRESFKKYGLFNFSIKDLKFCMKLALEGLPIGFQMFADFFGGYLCNVMTGWLSVGALSASRIVDMIYAVPYLLICRSPQATCIFTGHARKANNKDLIKKLYIVTVGSMVGLTAAWGGIAYLFSGSILQIFVDTSNSENQNIVSLANNLIWLYPIALVFETARYAAAGTLRGMNDYKISMFNSFAFLIAVGSGLTYAAYKYGETLPWIFEARIAALGLAAVSLMYQCKRKVTDFFANNTLPVITPVVSGAASAVKSCFKSVCSFFYNTAPGDVIAETESRAEYAINRSHC